MSKLRHYVPYECLKSYYYGKVHFCLQYAVLARDGCNTSRLHKSNVLHNKIVKLMVLQHLPADTRLSNATIYRSLSLLQLSDIYKLELGKFMHKASYKALLKCLKEMVKRMDSVHNYPTSSSRKNIFTNISSICMQYSPYL